MTRASRKQETGKSESVSRPFAMLTWDAEIAEEEKATKYGYDWSFSASSAPLRETEFDIVLLLSVLVRPQKVFRNAIDQSEPNLSKADNQILKYDDAEIASTAQ